MNNHDDGVNKGIAGSIKISQDVVAAITKNATLEIDGVSCVSAGNAGIKGLLTKTNYSKPIRIELNEGVARIQVSIIVDSSKRIPDLANAIQLSVKNAVQNMTGLTVSGVDVIIAGIIRRAAESE